MKTVVICDTDGVLTDGTVSVDSNGAERLVFSKRDGWLLREADEAGIEVVVCTLDPNPGPSRERAVKMGLEHVALTTPEGKRDLVLERKATGARVVYIGDSPQDIPAMQAADRAFCPCDADLSTAGAWIFGAWWYAKEVDDAGPNNGLCWVVNADGGEGVLYDVLKLLLREMSDAKPNPRFR